MAYKIEHRQVVVKTGRVLTGGWENWWTEGERPEGVWFASLEQAQEEIDVAVERNSDFVYTRLEFRIVEG